ncbi:hypothetical protein AUG19_03235 [archaeon 13_1_20CM_2_54_9]|nr:MAG: hypothetical protein AUG19_03235 [archaeon 13_1_20CM_2_54_9]
MCSLWNDFYWSTKTNSASNRLVHASAMVSPPSCGSMNRGQQDDLAEPFKELRLIDAAHGYLFVGAIRCITRREMWAPLEVQILQGRTRGSEEGGLR